MRRGVCPQMYLIDLEVLVSHSYIKGSERSFKKGTYLTLAFLDFDHQKLFLGFPCGPVVENLLASAEDEGLIAGQGTKIPHAVGQLSLQAATIEPTHSN